MSLGIQVMRSCRKCGDAVDLVRDGAWVRPVSYDWGTGMVVYEHRGMDCALVARLMAEVAGR